MAVRGPATPSPSRDIDLEENQSLRGQRRRQNMIDLPQRCATAAHFGFHFLWFEQTQRIFALSGRAAQGELEIAIRFNFNFMLWWYVEHIWLAHKYVLALQCKGLISHSDTSLAAQRHDSNFGILCEMAMCVARG